MSRAGQRVLRDFRAELAEHHFGLADIDFAAFARPLAAVEKGERADGADAAGGVVGVYRGAIAHAVRVIRVAPLAGQPGPGAHKRAVAFQLGPRAGLSESGALAHNDARVDGFKRGVVEAEPLEHAAAEIGKQDVALFDQIGEDCLAFFAAQIEA